MNKKQKIIIGIGLALILLSGLFPAYEVPINNSGIFNKYLGYHFLFSHPLGYEYERAHIVISYFVIQIVTILLLTIGLVFLFADPKHENKSPSIKR